MTLGHCATGSYLALEPPWPEVRFAVEFLLGGLPPNATITGATLRVATTNASPAVTSVYGYAGDGTITDVDVQVSGTPATFLNVGSTPADYGVTGLMTTAMMGAGWAGFSFRDQTLTPLIEYVWVCPTTPAISSPVLTITYDLPTTPQASLLSTDMANPATGSPSSALGFAVLLLGALGVLAVVNVRGVVSRR